MYRYSCILLIFLYFSDPVICTVNSMKCGQIEKLEKSSTCYMKSEPTRIFSRKKRFIVFPNYCAMKITVATGKKVIVRYPRGINLSLEVSVYYPLPTILEEWYPKQFRSSTTPKPKIPKRKNPPIFPRIDDPSIDFINSPSTNQFNQYSHLNNADSKFNVNSGQISPISSFQYPQNLNRKDWKSNLNAWRQNSTNWHTKTHQRPYHFTQKFSAEPQEVPNWNKFANNKVNWSKIWKKPISPSELNQTINQQQIPDFNPPIHNYYHQNPAPKIYTNKQTWNRNQQYQKWNKPAVAPASEFSSKSGSDGRNYDERRQRWSDYSEYEKYDDHDIYKQVPKLYPDIQEYEKSWKHYRGHRDRRDIYGHLETLTSLFSIDIKSCILRSICESKRYLLPPGYSLIQDILRIVFSFPTLNGVLDEYSNAMRDENGECGQSFQTTCPLSILDLIMNPDKPI